MKRPLKIVCLHGYCQNAQLFRRKSGALRKSLERSVASVRRAVYSECAESTAGYTGPTSDDEAFPLAQLEYLDAPFVFEDRLTPPGGNTTSESEKYISVYRPVRVAVSTGGSGSTTRDTDRSSSGAHSEATYTDPDAPPLDRTRRSWWQAEDSGLTYNGWEQTLQDLRSAFREHVSH